MNSSVQMLLLHTRNSD